MPNQPPRTDRPCHSLATAHVRRAARAAALVSLLSSCAPAEVVVPVGSGGSGQGLDAGSSASGGSVGAGSGGNTGSGGAAVGTGGAATSGGNSGSGTGGSGSGGSASGGSGTGGAGTGGAGSGTGGAVGGSGPGTGGRGGSTTGGAGGRVGAGGAAGSGSTAVCPAAALVCEDFEDGQAQGWSALASGMTIDTQHARSGTNAVLLNIPAGGRGGFISRKGAPLFPLVNKTMWGRVMVWFDAIADGHTDIVRGQSASGGNPAYNLAEQHGDYMLNYYNGSAATDCWARPKAPTPTKVPLGKWMCWEWKFDSGTNNMQFFVDSTLYRAVNMTGDGCLSGNGVWAAPADFGTISVGAYIAEVGGAMKMWFDDIAIGSQERIGCPAP